MLGGVLVIGLVGRVLGIGDEDRPAASPASAALFPVSTPGTAAPGPSTNAAVASSTIPDLVGETGAIAAEELREAGFTEIAYGSGTPGVSPVQDLSDWTVTSIEPRPGTVVMSNSTIVVTLTKSNP